MIHNRKPTRLPGHDYSQNGYYFITICTKDRREWFGHKENGAIILNEFGETAKRMWLAIPRHFDGIELDEFVIMPNHIHGIIIIDNVGTRHALSLSTMIGSFKSAVSRYMHYAKNESDFKWQRSFYDHVIRNERSLMHVREYVLRNSPAEFGLW